MKKTFTISSVVVWVLLSATWAVGQDKYNVAVIDLEGRGVTETEVKTLSDKLRGELFVTDTFTVIERSQMNEVLKEQGFQQLGCTSQECVVEMGQLMGVSKIIMGSVGKVGETFLISIRMIDVKTGKIVRSVEEEMQGRIDDVLRWGIRNVARKMAGLKTENRPKAENSLSDKTKPDTVSVKKLVGSISVQVSPEAMEVFVNGKSYGRGSMLVERLPVGRYEIRGKEKGRTRIKRVVFVRPHQISNVELKVSNWRSFVWSPQVSRGDIGGEGTLGFVSDLGFKYRPIYVGGNFGLGQYLYYRDPYDEDPAALDSSFLRDSVVSARLPNKWMGGGLSILFEGLNFKDIAILGLGWNAGYWRVQFKDESFVDSTTSPVTPRYDYEYSTADYFGGPRVRLLLGYKHFYLDTDLMILLGSPKVRFLNSGFVLSF